MKFILTAAIILLLVGMRSKVDTARADFNSSLATCNSAHLCFVGRLTLNWLTINPDGTASWGSWAPPGEHIHPLPGNTQQGARLFIAPDGTPSWITPDGETKLFGSTCPINEITMSRLFGGMASNWSRVPTPNYPDYWRFTASQTTTLTISHGVFSVDSTLLVDNTTSDVNRTIKVTKGIWSCTLAGHPPLVTPTPQPTQTPEPSGASFTSAPTATATPEPTVGTAITGPMGRQAPPQVFQNPAKIAIVSSRPAKTPTPSTISNR